MSDNAMRIDVHSAHKDLASGALLVCAYDDDEKWQQNHLAGAIALADFREREASLARNQEIIFYCA